MLLSIVALLPLVVLALPQQQHQQQQQQLTFQSTNPSSNLNIQNTQNDFSILKHKHFPHHSVRIRSPKLNCDPDVEQKSGYLDNVENNRHFYFWQFDSRNDVKNDPVVMWLNGGPGCSSFTGLLQELGPCRIQKEGLDPIINPYSWNNNATLIFLDQPVGVGYSYGEKNDKGVWTTEAAAHDVYAFLQIFFETFNEKFGNSAFHIAGESYGGRYIPLFADYIVEQNLLNEGKLNKINLKSVLIGNGFTNPKIQYGGYLPTACTNVTGYGPYVGEKACAKMAATLPRCQELEQKCYDDVTDAVACLAAVTYCEKTQTEAYYATGRNPYDMEKFGPYAEEEQIAYYLNRDDVRHELGVDKEAHGGVKKFIGCSDAVGEKFATSGDQGKPSYLKVKHFLENGVSALFYAGRADFICNYIGNNEWLQALEWSGQTAFNAEPLRPWYASSEAAALGEKAAAGEYKSAGNLAFAIVNDAGHFVPYDRPVESLAMFNGWIHGEDFWTNK